MKARLAADLARLPICALAVRVAVLENYQICKAWQQVLMTHKGDPQKELEEPLCQPPVLRAQGLP